MWSHAVFRDSPVPQLVLDPSGRIALANPAAQDLVSRRSLAGVDLGDLLGDADRGIADSFIAELSRLPSGVRREIGPLTLQWHGERRVVALIGSRSSGVEDRQMLTVSVREIDSADQLTGAPGRAGGLAALAAAIGPDSPGCLLVVDLDGFEDLNVTFGIGAGDRILVEVARRLRAAVPPGTHVARIDGDAFLVTAPGVPLENAGTLAGRVLAAVAAPMRIGDTPVVVGASIGGAALMARTADAALAAGLRALAVAKDRGGGQLIVDTPMSRVRGRRRSDLIAALQESEEETAAARLEARTDPLTGLANRRRLDEDRVALQNQARASGQWVGAVYLDLDEFGAINKTHGDAHGDQALADVATVLQGLLRAEDGVYRKGGEEFVLLLVDADPEGALRVAERVRAAIESAGILHAGTPDRPVVTATLGVTADRGPDLDLREVIAGAERAMRRAKVLGRNQVVAGLVEAASVDPDLDA